MNKRIFLSLLYCFMIGGLLLVGCTSLNSYEIPGSPVESTIPSISISSVDQGISVSINAVNFPPDTKLTAYVNLVGTEGVDGVVVGTKKSGSTGSLSKTFEIPSEFKNENQLVIRLEGGAGYWAYNTFNNK